MAKNETPKSKAELYREERKARIAKAAKQNSKNSEKRKTASKALKIIVTSAIAILLVALIAGSSIVSAIGSLAPAVKIGDTKISATEFNFYYMAAFNDVANQAAQAQQMYGSNVFGFDSSLPPDEQETTDADGNTITWADVIRDNAVSFAQQTIGYYNEAKAAGLTLSEDENAEINETIENYRKEAADNGYTLNAYLKLYYGNGFKEKTFKKILEIEFLAKQFIENKQTEINDSITDDIIEKEYKANKKDYDYTDIRYFTINFKTLTAKENESADALKKRQKEANDKLIADAKEILAKATDDAAFIEAVKAYNKNDTDTSKKTIAATYASLKTALGDDGAKWAYADGRKAGDATVITSENAAHVVFCIKPAYNANSVSVRHCLITIDAKDANNITDAEKKAAHKKATELLEGLGDKVTEEKFSKMATENTADEGSAANGGLYENIRISGNFVENFEAWCFDPARKAGDTGIVETEHGYHIMYLVSDNEDDQDWKNTIKTNKANDELTKYQEELFAEDGANAIIEKEFWTKYVVDNRCDLMRKSIARSNASY